MLTGINTTPAGWKGFCLIWAFFAFSAILPAQERSNQDFRDSILKALHYHDTTVAQLSSAFVDLAQVSGDKILLADALHLHGLALRQREETMTAIPVFLRELNIRMEIKDVPGQAEVNLELGDAYRAVFDAGTAEFYLREAYSLFENLENHSGLARSLNRMAAIKLDFSPLAGSAEGYALAEKSLEMAVRISDFDLQVNNLILMAFHLRSQSQIDSSLNLLFRAQELMPLVHEKQHLSLVYINIGHAYIHDSKYQLAVDYYRKAYVSAELAGIKVYQWLSAYGMGSAFFKAEEPDSGYKYWSIGFEARLEIIDDVRARQKAIMEEQYLLQRHQLEMDFKVRSRERGIVVLSLFILLLAMSAAVSLVWVRRLKRQNRLLAERSETIRKQALELEMLNNQKDKVYSVIAHDLRSPFSSILGLSEILEEELFALDNQGLRQMAGHLNQSASRVFDMLVNLLEWTRLQQGGLQIKPVVIEIDTLLKKVAEPYWEALKKKKIRFSLDTNGTDTIYADRMRIESVLRNLISNALKFTPEGGSVMVSTSRTAECHFVIDVRDSGIGMDDETLNLIRSGEPIMGRAGTQGEPSAGIGLSIVREFVDQLGGTIIVDSKLGQGSLFTITLPGQRE